MTGTILFQDSFDGYGAAADLVSSGRYSAQASGWSTTGGRYGGSAAVLQYFGGPNAIVSKPLPSVAGDSPTNKLYWSASLKIPSGNSVNILAFADSLPNLSATTASNVNSHIAFRVETNGGLSVWRGGTQIGSTTAAGTIPAIYHRFETEIYIDDTSGTVVVKINEVQVFSFTGDTRNGATAGIQYWCFQANGGSGGDVSIDDVLVGANTGFIGDVRIEKLTVTGNGSTVTGTAVGAATAAQAVDDVGMFNSDTDYVSNQTLNNIDLFTFSDLVGTPTSIIGIGIVVAARADGTNSKKIQTAAKSSATTGLSGTDLTVFGQISYQAQSGFIPNDPNTSAAWANAAAVNAAELGYKITL